MGVAVKVENTYEAASKSARAIIYPAVVELSSGDFIRGNSLAAARRVEVRQTTSVEVSKAVVLIVQFIYCLPRIEESSPRFHPMPT